MKPSDRGNAQRLRGVDRELVGALHACSRCIDRDHLIDTIAAEAINGRRRNAEGRM